MTKEIVLTNGMTTIVDDSDYEWLSRYTWSPVKTKWGIYARASVDKVDILMHRLILGLSRGDGLQADHIDHNTLNNQRLNIRKATPQQNSRNQNITKANTSGFKGVKYIDRIKAWRAEIRFNGKHEHLGDYVTAEDAARAYDKAARFIDLEFSKTNLDGSEYDSPKNIRAQNRARRKEKTTSKYLGVCKIVNRWESHISPNYTSIHLGMFTHEIQAAFAYDQAALKYFGNETKLNGITQEQLDALPPEPEFGIMRRTRFADGVRKDNKSGFKGVSFDKRRNKWSARFKMNGKYAGLGYFPTPELAAVAYNKASRNHAGEFAYQNKV